MKSFLSLLAIVPILFCLSANAENSQPTEAEVLAQLQIGPKWDKVQIDSAHLKKFSKIRRRAALSIANFKHGTSFFVGIVKGHYVMATNAHVAANRNDDLLPERISRITSNPKSICYRSDDSRDTIESVRFDLQNKSFECDQLIGIWPSVELALFTIKVESADQDFFKHLGLRFDFSNPPVHGDQLVTMGYGEFMNPGEPNVALMDTSGPTCRTFSLTGDFRYMTDPDEHSPGPYKVWSFAIGCTLAWGDSGSPVINPRTGGVVGILWTGRYPKIAAVQDPTFLHHIAKFQTAEVWSQLNYASPALKVRDVLMDDLKNSTSLGLKFYVVKNILSD